MYQTIDACEFCGCFKTVTPERYIENEDGACDFILVCNECLEFVEELDESDFDEKKKKKKFKWQEV